MIIEDGKIVKTTDAELFEYWLRHWSDVLPYEDYKQQVKHLGTVVVD